MLHAVDDDALARLHALEHDALGLDPLAELDLAIGDLVVGADDIDEFLALIEAERAVGISSPLRSVASASLTDTNMPGSSARSALSNLARARMVPLAASMRLSKL